MDVEEYAKQKGIPVGAIPVEAFKKIQTEGVTLRKAKGDSKAEAFKMLCTDTKELLEKCGAAEGGVSAILPFVLSLCVYCVCIYFLYCLFQYNIGSTRRTTCC